MSLAGSSLTLSELFPEADFIFPTSKVRRVASAKGIRSTQWFDLSSIISSDERQDLQYEGTTRERGVHSQDHCAGGGARGDGECCAGRIEPGVRDGVAYADEL